MYFLDRSRRSKRPAKFQGLTGNQKLDGKNLRRFVHPTSTTSRKALRTCSTLLTTFSAFRAENPPIATWSSFPADVDSESTEAGWQRTCIHPWVKLRRNNQMMQTLFSETNAEAVQCASMNPELNPPSWTRNAGNPLNEGLTSRSIRRSLMEATSWIPTELSERIGHTA